MTHLVNKSMSAAADDAMSPQAVREAANRWYRQQLELSARCLGTSWPDHREWVEAYLRAELRERLIALGWRPAHGR